MKAKKKILIIEDDSLVVTILNYILENEGFETVVAEDGNEGAEALTNEKPDLILMDLLLPYKSGLEITSLAKHKYPEVPIIIVSSLGLIDETIQAAFKLGAHSVVSKPFLPTELVSKIKTALSS